MSYGVWKNRRKNWSSIEIDTPGNGCETMSDLHCNNPALHKRIVTALRKYEISPREMGGDRAYLNWRLYQAKQFPNRVITEYCPGGGEHVCWIAYGTAEDLQDALRILGATKLEREQISLT